MTGGMNSHIEGELMPGCKVLVRERALDLRLTSRDLGGGLTRAIKAKLLTYTDTDSRQHVVHEDIVDMALPNQVPHQRPIL